MGDFDLVGYCAFCQKSSHEFPEDTWHDMKHDAGWHSCDVYGGFRFHKPGCDEFEISEDVIFSSGQ